MGGGDRRFFESVRGSRGCDENRGWGPDMGAGGADPGQVRGPDGLHLGSSVIRRQLVLLHRCTERLAPGRIRAGGGNAISRVAWAWTTLDRGRPLPND